MRQTSRGPTGSTRGRQAPGATGHILQMRALKPEGHSRRQRRRKPKMKGAGADGVGGAPHREGPISHSLQGVGARGHTLPPPTVPSCQGFLKKGWGRPTVLTELPPGGGRLPKPCRGSRAPAGRAGLSWPRVQLARNHRDGRPTPTPGSSSATLPAKPAQGQTPTVQFRSDSNPTRSYTPAPGKWRLSKAEQLAQNHTAGKPGWAGARP